MSGKIRPGSIVSFKQPIQATVHNKLRVEFDAHSIKLPDDGRLLFVPMQRFKVVKVWKDKADISIRLDRDNEILAIHVPLDQLMIVTEELQPKKTRRKRLSRREIFEAMEEGNRIQKIYGSSSFYLADPPNA